MMSTRVFSPLAGPLGALFLLGMACGTEVPPAAPPAPAPVVSVAPAASSAPAQVASAPAAPPPPPPCSEVVKKLAFGKTLDRHSEELKGLPQGEHGALTELFPTVKADGYVVEQVVAIQIGNDESARALILHKPQENDEGPFGVSDTWLGFASCTADRGYVMEKSPPSLGDNSATVVWGVERQLLPGGSTATLMTLALGGVALEFHALAYLLGTGSERIPVREPKGAKLGVLGVFGHLSEQFLIPGQSDNYARTDTVEGTGFYPLAGQLTFIALRAELGQVRGMVQGWIAPDGVKSRDSSSRDASWVALGKGELPAFCSGNGLDKIRCSRLAVRPSMGKLPADWIAGAWPSADEAARALRALGADPAKLDYLLVDPDDDRQRLKGPGGKNAPTFLKITPPPPAKKAPPKGKPKRLSRGRRSTGMRGGCDNAASWRRCAWLDP